MFLPNVVQYGHMRYGNQVVWSEHWTLHKEWNRKKITAEEQPKRRSCRRYESTYLDYCNISLWYL